MQTYMVELTTQQVLSHNPWLSGYNPVCHDIVILWYWCVQICGRKSKNMVKMQKDTKNVTLVANHGWSLQKFFLVRQ